MNQEPLPQLEELDANFGFGESHRDKTFRDLVRVRKEESSTTMIEFLKPTSTLPVLLCHKLLDHEGLSVVYVSSPLTLSTLFRVHGMLTIDSY